MKQDILQTPSNFPVMPSREGLEGSLIHGMHRRSTYLKPLFFALCVYWMAGQAAAQWNEDTVPVSGEPIETEVCDPGEISLPFSFSQVDAKQPPDCNLMVSMAVVWKPLGDPGEMCVVGGLVMSGPPECQDFDQVVVENILPEGLTGIATDGCDEDLEGNGIGLPNCSLGTVERTLKTYTITILVDDTVGDSITNCVSIIDSVPMDTLPGDNTACATLYRPLFEDGFESGDISGWSNSTP